MMKKTYFPCDLPKTMAEVAHCAGAETFLRMADAIRKRTDMLNEALDIAGIQPERFATAAKVVFDTAGTANFDALAPAALATTAVALASTDPNVYEARMEWPNAVAVVDCRFVETEEWEALRHFGLGGSDAASIQGLSPYKTAVDTFFDKTNRVVRKDDKDVVFRRGHVLEDDVINAFCKTYGGVQVPEYRMFRSKRYPHVTANIDAIIRLPGNKITVFEAKTTVEENWPAWANGSVPVQYIPQTRQYPAVLDDNRIIGTYIGCLFTKDYVLSDTYVGSSYDGERFKCQFIERDEMEEDCQLQMLEDFWNDYIATGIEPPANMYPAARNLETFNSTITTADKNKTIVNLPVTVWGETAQEILQLGEQLKAVQAKEAALQEQKKTRELEFIKELGTATEGHIYLSDGKRYVEVKNSPRSRETIKSKELKVLIDGLAAYGVDPGYINQLQNCFEKPEESFRVFSLKVKDVKKTKK